MKIIHTADIHLGSKMRTVFPKALADARATELRNTFLRMIEYAHTNGAKVIMLSGDIFDSDSPFKKDKDLFYSAIRSNSDVDFIYLRGNHDVDGAYLDEKIDNLKLFCDKWQTYRYGNVAITGIEMTDENATSLYSSLSLDKNDVNIVMLHGEIADRDGKYKINLKKLRNKNIDYLALGHIHKPGCGKLDDRGVYAYCGCPEGRGFDETGERGFNFVEIEDKLSYKFIPFAERTIYEHDVDVSGAKDEYAVCDIVKSRVALNKLDIYRINLVGEVDFSVDSLESTQKYLSSDCLYISVKDKTKRKINIDDFIGDLSLRGEFVRGVYANDSYTDEEKVKILTYGLRALEGGDLDL